MFKEQNADSSDNDWNGLKISFAIYVVRREIEFYFFGIKEEEKMSTVIIWQTAFDNSIAATAKWRYTVISILRIYYFRFVCVWFDSLISIDLFLILSVDFRVYSLSILVVCIGRNIEWGPFWIRIPCTSSIAFVTSCSVSIIRSTISRTATSISFIATDSCCTSTANILSYTSTTNILSCTSTAHLLSGSTSIRTCPPSLQCTTARN